MLFLCNFIYTAHTTKRIRRLKEIHIYVSIDMHDIIMRQDMTLEKGVRSRPVVRY